MEIFKTFDECDYYEASNWGRIRNKKTKQLIAQWQEKNKNNQMVTLHYNGSKRNYSVARVVYSCFYNVKKNASIVHVDGNKQNNNLSNLRQTMNAGLYSKRTIDKSGEFANDSFKIDKYTLEGEYVETYNSISQAAILNGIPTTNISKVALGQRNQAGGYIWRYTDRIDFEVKNSIDPKIIKKVRQEYANSEKPNIRELQKLLPNITNIESVRRILNYHTYNEYRFYPSMLIDTVNNLIKYYRKDQIIYYANKLYNYKINQETVENILNEKFS